MTSIDNDDRRLLCDDTLALLLSERLRERARYVAEWRRWLVFSGTRWRPEETVRLLSEARAVCRNAARAAWDPRMQARIRSAATVAALERLARSDLRHAASVEQWDADPWLLNTPGGTVDLRTGAKTTSARPPPWHPAATVRCFARPSIASSRATRR